VKLDAIVTANHAGMSLWVRGKQAFAVEQEPLVRFDSFVTLKMDAARLNGPAAIRDNHKAGLERYIALSATPGQWFDHYFLFPCQSRQGCFIGLKRCQ
jgi:hypothetical protein